jgi:glycosyltransferase involved in cell wall biosynthesis
VRIALDATYSVDPYPSGITIYSRELLAGLRAAYADDEFIHAYRWKQWWSAPENRYRSVQRRLLLPPVPTFRADIFHALNQRVDRRPAKAVISTFHDLFVMTGDYSSPEFRSRFSEQARRAAANSDFIIAVSEFTARQVAELLRVERARIFVVPHGVHPARTPVTNKRENVVLFVGALQTRKNVTRLVEAFERASLAWRLVLAGSPSGHGARDILERIVRSPCRDRIEVTGYVSPERLEGLYRAASIFAFPSLDEGFGIPVLEAMAYGVPVVTSNRSALPEVAGTAALLVDPAEIDEIESALNRLMNDDDLRVRLANAGRLRAAQYTWKRAVQETYRVYVAADRY